MKKNRILINHSLNQSSSLFDASRNEACASENVTVTQTVWVRDGQTLARKLHPARRHILTSLRQLAEFV